MDEALLQYIWLYQLYDNYDLKTTQGEPVQIFFQGYHNTDAGPDFFNAKIQIGATTWAGNVEIHKKTSDWNIHRHSCDNAYNNVILHVVAEHDCEVFNNNGTIVPALILKYNRKIAQNYKQLYDSRNWVPCQTYFESTDSSVLELWLESLVIERLERKSTHILNLLDKTQNHYNEVFYRLFTINLGQKTNTDSFERLSRNLPLQTLSKFADNITQVEAVLYGQAGFLEGETIDEYHAVLQKEFQILKQRFSLVPFDKSIWKFFRMRPANFPTQRIAQLAAIISHGTNFTGLVLEVKNLSKLYSYFQQSVSNYWEKHINFGKPTRTKHRCAGKQTISNIFINTIIPFIFVYGINHDNEELKNKALSWLEQIDAENNHIIEKWKTIGANIKNAKHSQAFIELKNEYCTKKRCLQCPVGSRIVSEV